MKSDAYGRDMGDADMQAEGLIVAEERRRLYNQAVLFPFVDLESIMCRCGAPKHQRRAFCDPCLTSLPEEMQRSLRGERERFPKAYLRALHQLGFLSAERLERGLAILDGRDPRQGE